MRLKEFVSHIGGSTGNLFSAPPEYFDANPDNLRDDCDDLRAHIASLAVSMKAHGYLETEPLVVRFLGDRLQVQEGNCRLLAVRLAMANGAEIRRIPFIAEPANLSDADRLARMILANSGRGHTSTELAKAIRKFRSWGWTDTEIADKLRISRATIANTLQTAALPADVRALVDSGKVAATTARKMVRADSIGAAATIAKAAEARGGKKVTERHLREPAATVAAPVAVLPAPVIVDGPALVSASTPAADPDNATQDALVTLRQAVRGFLAAWDDPNSGRVNESVAVLRECVS
jgi:ParB/RepB/Spo0J family partition protein